MASERAIYSIIVDGQNVSSAFRPILTSLSVTLQSGGVSDQAAISVDDSGGRVQMPRDDAAVSILLGWAGGAVTEVFRGKVNDVQSEGSRSGLTLSIGCTGMDTKGQSREPRDKHYDEMTVGDILKAAGAAAGIPAVLVAAEIAGIKLPYFAQLNESFVHMGHRLSQMVGGTFKIMGDRAVMVKRNAGQSASGKPLTPVTAARGVNLIDWKIKPYLGRPRMKETETRWYDRKKAKWVSETATTADTEAKAKGRSRFAASGETEAKSKAGREAGEAERDKGEGTVTINGEPLAQPEASCTVSGARAGIDGAYLIDQVTHSLDRGGGFVTALTLKKPQ